MKHGLSWHCNFSKMEWLGGEQRSLLDTKYTPFVCQKYCMGYFMEPWQFGDEDSRLFSGSFPFFAQCICSKVENVGPLDIIHVCSYVCGSFVRPELSSARLGMFLEWWLREEELFSFIRMHCLFIYLSSRPLVKYYSCLVFFNDCDIYESCASARGGQQAYF